MCFFPISFCSHADRGSQRWTGQFYEEATLTSLGQVVQLGHLHGDSCPSPSALKDHLVFDLNGAHRLVIRYCRCPSNSVSHRRQLLRARWFPASVNRPSTSFTFTLLDFFHKLQDQNKCNTYDFYHTIMQRTDNAGVHPEIVSSQTLHPRQT